MKKITISGKNNYEVYIKSGIYESIDQLLEKYKYKKFLIIYDENVNIDPFDDLNIPKKSLKVKGNEFLKSEKGLEQILNFFEQNKLQKNSLVVAIGGGTVTDVVGFAASIYMRGVDVAFVPTTLIGMVDAAVGSKNGIDYKQKKNFLGTFYDPKFVLIDPVFLDTLDKRQLNSGIAEIIKIAFLEKIKILELLEEEELNWEKIIYFAISAKNKYLEKDFEDQKERMFLNFGHTYGHAIESYYGFEKYTHGEAVSIGMCLAYPQKRLINVLKKYDLPVTLDVDVNLEELYKLMKNDKKNTETDKVKIITLDGAENPIFSSIESQFDIMKSLERIRIITNEW